MLAFASGVAAGYWAVPHLLAALQPGSVPSSPPPGSVTLTDTTTSPSTDATTGLAAPSQPAFQPLTLTGHGQQASKIINLPAGGYRITMTHDGQNNFIVILDNGQGKQVEVLANQSGKANVSQAVSVDAGNYLFNVGADGNWTIKVEAL